MTEPYSASEVEIFFGTNTKAVNLKTSLSAAFTLTPVGAIPAFKIQAQSARTADCVAVGFTASGAFYRTTEVETALGFDLGSNFLAIVRKDAKFGYVIPADINSVAEASDAAGAVVVTLGFKQRSRDLAFTGVVAEAGKNYTKSNDNRVATVGTAGIKMITANATAATPADSFSVTGSNLIAEGITS